MLSDVAFCRVCGYESEIPPWGPSGAEPSFEICPCCGVEWGYEDSLPAGVLAYRAEWVAAGARWTMSGVVHDGLTTQERLARLSEELR